MHTYEDLSAQLAEDIVQLRRQADTCKTAQRQRIRNLGHMVMLIANDIKDRKGEIRGGEVRLSFSEDATAQRLGVAPGTVLEYLKDLGSREIRYYLG